MPKYSNDEKSILGFNSTLRLKLFRHFSQYKSITGKTCSEVIFTSPASHEPSYESAVFLLRIGLGLGLALGLVSELGLGLVLGLLMFFSHVKYFDS